jgi:hypothetical protein
MLLQDQSFLPEREAGLPPEDVGGVWGYEGFLEAATPHMKNMNPI